MKTFELVFFNWDEAIEYERRIIKCDTYAEMLVLAGRRCNELMEELNLEDIYWNYTEVC